MRSHWPLAIRLWPPNRTGRAARIGILVALAILTLAGVALASGTYELPWFTMDSGGGESAGGGFTLTGTAGQADAGALSGGSFTLIGGFWPGAGPNALRYLPVVMK
jgi:hypothetical protein